MQQVIDDYLVELNQNSMKNQSNLMHAISTSSFFSTSCSVNFKFILKRQFEDFKRKKQYNAANAEKLIILYQQKWIHLESNIFCNFADH